MLLGGAAPPGRSRCARSSGAHAARWCADAHAPRTMQSYRPAWRRLRRASSNWAGPSDRTCGSITAGAPAMPTTMRKHAADLVALAPEVILAHSSAAVAPLLQASRTIPIVFTMSPIRSGPASSAAWRIRAAMPPAFPYFEYAMGGEVAGAAQRDRAPHDAGGGPSRIGHSGRAGPVRRIQAVAPALGVELRPIDVRDAGEIERDITAFAQGSNGGLMPLAC